MTTEETTTEETTTEELTIRRDCTVVDANGNENEHDVHQTKRIKWVVDPVVKNGHAVVIFKRSPFKDGERVIFVPHPNSHQNGYKLKEEGDDEEEFEYCVMLFEDDPNSGLVKKLCDVCDSEIVELYGPPGMETKPKIIVDR